MRRTGPALSGPAVALGLLLACLCAASAHDHNKVTAYKVCPTMDIRNELDNLYKLRNCTVIEGQLNIVLMEKTNVRSFENISFPELREVTGYITIYRLKGLISLGKLFPNLSVIRGMSLFRDYALVIYGNENLKTLGLRSLSRIERGSVRIEQNDQLCYTNSIDWGRIVVSGADNNVIKHNYYSRLCGRCPESAPRSPDGRGGTCPKDPSGKALCWDENHCQKLCPGACGERACTWEGACCHAACIGGCDGPSQHQCHACRHYSLGYGDNRTCVASCPIGTYKYLRRCVSELECHDMLPQTSDGKKHKIFNGTCIYNCPVGYMEVGNNTINLSNSTCIPCPKEGCVKECSGGVIDSMNAAANFRGCTHVKGTISITLRAGGGNTMAELESSLGEIREIEGYLKVIRSHSLVSLSFLKSLRRIVGRNVERGRETDDNSDKKQTLYIFNNPNLELLWNWTKHGSIEIMHGKLFIHLNPKLCYNLIAPLKNMTRDPVSKFDELEVSESNNGDQAACSQDVLQLGVSEIHQTAVILKWNPYCLEDTRKLLGYSLYYIVANYNITQYERRDACYDSWNVLDIPFKDESPNASIKLDSRSKTNILLNPCKKMQPIFHLMSQLTPYTRYAAYVKTFMTLQEKRGAQSPIIYFKTLPGQPSPPLNVVVESLDPHGVYIRWSPPTMPNGTLDVYRVEIQANSYNRRQILQTDYCKNPSSFGNVITQLKEESQEKEKYLPKNNNSKNDSCSCRSESVKQAPKARLDSNKVDSVAESIEFENALQNEVYVRRPSAKRTSNRTRRAVDNSLVIVSNFIHPVPDKTSKNVSDEDGYFSTVYFTNPGDELSIMASNLRHFTWYTVSVWACRAKDPRENEVNYKKWWCSERGFTIFRTAQQVNADVVTNVRAEIITSNKTLASAEVNVTWEPPKNPNGFVVAYDMHHSRIDPNNPQSPDVVLHSCISAAEFENSGRGYFLRNLAPGNYTIKVTPISISGPGNVSAEIFVLIPERGTSSGYEWVWGVIGGCFVMLIVLGGGVWYAKRGLLPSAEANKLYASVNPEYASTVYVPDEWEVPRSSIEYGKELGQGSFGMVYEGCAKNIIKGQAETRCAVKTVNEHATDRERIEFLKEASVMKAFDTFHVVRLLGVVSRGQPTLVVMELMELGDLKSYLRSHRPDDGSLPRDQPRPQPPSLQRVQQMAIEIADGMAYLSAKKFVHRDLAARNCMVAGDLTVKVGDFGMTRDIYETDYYRKGSKGLLPVRWMSPESLKDGVFSSHSDVWSFGVVLWEMATLAMQPYQGLSNEQVLRYVVEGGVMERPEHCPDRLYELMRACWAHRPPARPFFLQLVAELAPTSAPYFKNRSFFHSPQGQELYITQQRLAMADEVEQTDLNVGAVATGSGSNLFGVSGRLASWVRELSLVRSRGSDDAAAEPLAPSPSALRPAPIPLKPTQGPNGVLS